MDHKANAEMVALVTAVYDDCLEVAKDYTGQGQSIYLEIKRRKEKALAKLELNHGTQGGD